VRSRDNGRHHNQRLALWEYGRDIDYLTHKAKQAHMSSFTGSPNEAQVVSVPHVGRNRSRKRGNGTASSVVSKGIETW